MTIPYTFAGATTAIPLANLDANFASPITLGNVAMTLSNTYNSIGNLTLTNVTISSASGLAANTVAYANASGVLGGSANMTFDGSTLTTLNTAYTGTLTGGTGVVNLGSGQFYKDASGNVGIGTATPTAKLQVTSTTGGSSGLVLINQTAATNYPSLQVQQVGAGGNTGDIQGLRVVVDGTGAGYSVAVNRYGTNYTMLLRNDGIFMAGNSRFSPVGTSNSIPASTYYNEEKLYQISQGGSTANYDICTVTSAYTYGTLVIEVSGTIQYAGADQRTASNRKSIIQFKNGSITVIDLTTAYAGSFGTINFTYVSDGVIKINVTGATTGVGQGNGIAWVKCIGGNNSSGSVLTPLGFTLS